MTRRHALVVGSWRRVLWTLAAVLVLSAALSHVTAAALGVGFAPVNRLSVRPDLPGRPVAVLGSSTTLYGLRHEALARALGRPLATRFVPSGSPAELETVHAEVSAAAPTVVGVSIYDMNELVLADRRPELVPVRRAVSDLRESDADWPLTKRILGQYLMQGVARAFPTAGKSELVMAGVRRAAREAAAYRWPFRRPGPAARGGDGAAGTVVFDPRSIPDREPTLDTWPLEQRLRSVANHRAAGRDRHGFSGPKSRALRRLAGAAASRGGALVVVFPVSPFYAREFLDATAQAAFERELDELARAAPAAAILRLDRDPALQSDRAFRDLVHLGPEGRRHATGAVAAFLLHR